MFNLLLARDLEQQRPENGCGWRWTVRTLREKMGSMLFERTVISKQPEEVIKYELKKLSQTQQLTPDLVFRDPCFFRFYQVRRKTTSFRAWI